MALKDIWVNRVDGVDDVVAEDINNVANSVIELEDAIGDIDDALDAVLSIQESLIGTINFIIGGVSYVALKGMTWAEWCESAYNIDGYYCNTVDNSVRKENGDGVGYETDDSLVYGSDIIVDGEIYKDDI